VSAGRPFSLTRPRSGCTREAMARKGTAEPLIFRIGLIALVMISQAALLTLAFASPADPSVVSGIYDNADDDDVIALATSATGNVTSVVPALLPPRLPLIGCWLDCGKTAAAIRSVSALRPRAPPAA
jgi:hypothetical protein